MIAPPLPILLLVAAIVAVCFSQYVLGFALIVAAVITLFVASTRY